METMNKRTADGYLEVLYPYYPKRARVSLQGSVSGPTVIPIDELPIESKAEKGIPIIECKCDAETALAVEALLTVGTATEAAATTAQNNAESPFGIAQKKDTYAGETQSGRPRKGHWDLDERLMFLYGLSIYGKGHWKKVQAYVPHRSLVQIKSHAQKVLRRAEEGENVFKVLYVHKERLNALVAEANERIEEEKEAKIAEAMRANNLRRQFQERKNQAHAYTPRPATASTDIPFIPLEKINWQPSLQKRKAADAPATSLPASSSDPSASSGDPPGNYGAESYQVERHISLPHSESDPESDDSCRGILKHHLNHITTRGNQQIIANDEAVAWREGIRHEFIRFKRMNECQFGVLTL